MMLEADHSDLVPTPSFWGTATQLATFETPAHYGI